VALVDSVALVGVSVAANWAPQVELASKPKERSQSQEHYCSWLFFWTKS
jgi:hypothetical protein